MAFMKFYVGNEANASSHRDGIYIAIDTKKIFYNGSAYGGKDIDLSNYYTIAQVDGKIGTNTYTGANYISKETNLTDAVLQLDEEIKATNDNLTLEHENAEATYAKKTELGNYLPLSGGELNGHLSVIGDNNLSVDGSIWINGTGSKYTSLFEINKKLDSYRIYIGSDNRLVGKFSFDTEHCQMNHNSITFQKFTSITSSKESIINFNGFTISGKTSQDLLHANGGTVSIQDIIAQANVPTNVSQLTNDAGYQTESQVAAKVSALVDSAPETLDTLNELAAALGDDPNFATTITNQIASKVNITDIDVLTGDPSFTYLGNSVQAYFPGKRWDEELGRVLKVAYAPFINAATSTTAGVMSAADKAKLDTVEENANNYSLPLASASTRGGIKIGYTTTGKNYAVQLNDEKAFVNVPWTDQNVLQNAAISTDGSYNVLVGGSSNTTAQTGAVNKAGGLTYNPSTKVLSTTTFKGALNGNAATATKATQDASGNVIADTYAKKSDIVAPTVNAASGTLTLWTGTQDQYDTITSKSNTTLYFIMEK